MTLDISCNDCSKKPHCKTPCIFIDKLVGHGKRLQEYLAPPTVEDSARKYGTHSRVLADMVGAKKEIKRTIADIRGIPCLKRRTIAALLYANIKPSEMLGLLIMSRATLYRLIKGE